MPDVSNRIRWDSLLVRYLARELDDAFARARVDALLFHPEARVAALVTERGTLVLELHPERGWLRRADAPPAGEEVRLARQPRVLGVQAPADERVLHIALGGSGAAEGRARRLVVELMGNQWNALALDGRGHIQAVLWPRDAGARRLVRGAPYTPPPPAGREGVEAPVAAERWDALLADVEPRRRARALVGVLAWTSPLNAPAVLGGAASAPDPAELEAAWRRYRALASLPAPDPGITGPDDGAQPYPLPLPGRPHTATPTLLDALARVAEAAPAAAATGIEVSAGTLERLRQAVRRRRSRVRRMREELEGAGADADTLRARGDLLLSRLHELRRGMAEATLTDFDGAPVSIPLDPALSPTENAERCYDEARRKGRAAERLPALLETAKAEGRRLAELLRRAEAGEAGEEEVAAALGPAPAEAERRRGPALPYRRYRTSGGLEVRVGRNRRANDDLTFHHSSPGDVWLHARDVGGAHVVLRWNDADASPPAVDLAEAAVLAALNSRSRTSGTVPVDWTRRKYVRKPRKAPPGLVVLERAKTVFVEPDPAVERRLRLDED